MEPQIKPNCPYSNLVAQLSYANIHLLPSAQLVSMEQIRSVVPSGPAIVCDAYVAAAERGVRVPGGYQLGDVTNIDHHAPTREMCDFISSTPLAIEYVQAKGAAARDIPILINHTDCDSVLSALVMRGILPPDNRFAEAAIAADHTGAPNEIADLLQALTTHRDLSLSVRCLQQLLKGEPPDQVARDAFDSQLEQRQRAQDLVRSGSFRFDGPIAYARAEQYIDGAFLPALLPSAAVILLMVPIRDRGCDEAKLRLGMAAPQGLSLHDLGITQFDPQFGGRWNAGSNKRGGGTTVALEVYARHLRAAYQRVVGEE